MSKEILREAVAKIQGQIASAVEVVDDHIEIYNRTTKRVIARLFWDDENEQFELNFEDDIERIMLATELLNRKG